MAKLDLENMFKNFDSIFTGGSSSSKEKTTKSDKESKKSETKTKPNKNSYSEYKPKKTDMIHVEDENGNKIEAYWDPIAAKHFQDMKMKRIIENLRKNA